MSAIWGIALPASEMLVLLARADAVNDDGVATFMATLARKPNKSERTV